MKHAMPIYAQLFDSLFHLVFPVLQCVGFVSTESTSRLYGVAGTVSGHSYSCYNQAIKVICGLCLTLALKVTRGTSRVMWLLLTLNIFTSQIQTSDNSSHTLRV